MVQAAGITGGTLGLAPVPPLDLFGFKIDTYFRQYYLVWIVALLILLFTERALGMRVGRALRAIATSEIAAETLGVRTANWKLIAFVASAVFCAVAGALYAFVLAAITPSAFAFSAAILPIIMMLIGGGGSIWGGLVGAVLMTWISNSLSGTQQWSGVIYSVIMILLLLFLPMGITGLFTRQRLVSVKNAFRGQSRAETIECATVAEAEGSTGACETQVALPTYVPEHTRDATQAEADSGTLIAELRRNAGTTGEELLRVEGVSVDFGGLRAVNEVSMVVRVGQIAALIGPNGAGKTTLFNVVSRLQRASEGRVFLAGRTSRTSHRRTAPVWAWRARSRTSASSRTWMCSRTSSSAATGTRRPGSSPAASGCPASAARRGPPGCAPWTRCGSSAWMARRMCRLRACPTGSSGWWRSPAPSPPSRACCCSMSPPPA